MEEGGPEDPWACLYVGSGCSNQAYIDAFDLSVDPEPIANDWEVCNIYMHKCFDYGIAVADLAARVRRGQMGVLALSGFLEFMHGSRGVDLTPLTDRLDMLIEALLRW